MRKIIFLLTIIIQAIVCAQPTTTIDISKNIGINKTDLSNKIKPNDNYFGYVNDKWMNENPIPSTEKSWGMFSILDEDSKNVLKEIAEKSLLVENPQKGSSIQLIKDFYASGTNESSFKRKEGDEVLRYLLTKMANTQSTGDGINFLIDLLLSDIKIPFNFYVSQDAKNANKNILYLVPDGLGLPDKDYYTRNDEKSIEIREKYRAYIKNLVSIYGVSSENSANYANNILNFETLLASNMLSLVEKRDPQVTYNKYSLREAVDTFQFQILDTLLDRLDIKIDSVIVTEPEYFKFVSTIFTDENLEKYNPFYYFSFHIINSLSKYLSDDYVNARFDFYGKYLYGLPENEPRWKRVCTNMDMLLVDAVGQEYIKYRFSPIAKTKALTLVENIRKSYATRIQNLPWMSAQTKANAIEKLNKIDVKIGYPDKWIDYAGLEIKNQPYVYNILALKEFENKRQLAKLNKSVDRTEWLMGAQTVNAYYNPTMNEIVFPAAILQPPFFSEKADDACNYGGIGMVIGHEFTHGFDDEGRQFDAYGNLNDWWTKEDAEQFNKLAQAFVEQYNTYEPIDSLHINGELTLGENLADMGGLVLAYDAFKLAVPNENAIDGLSQSERFFINLAKIWRENLREDAIRNQVLTDPHSPPAYRVNGPLSNFDKFYEIYNVVPGDKMYKEKSKRNSIW